MDKKKPIASRPLAAGDTLSGEKPVPVSSSASSSGPSHGRRRSRKSRKSHRSVEAEPSWDRQTSVTTSAGSGISLPMIIGAAFLGLVVVGVGAWVVMGAQDSDQKNQASKTKVAQSTWENFKTTGPEIEMTKEEKKIQKEIHDSVNTGMDVMEESGNAVKAFLTADTSTDLEKYVRTPEVTIPRMRKWYATHEWVAPGVKETGYGGGVQIKGRMASMSVRLNDYSIKHIAMERTPDGYLIDWESWVAWTEMDWADLFKKRPTDLVEVRVICSRDNYYNRLFSDDEKWLAVKMTYPESDRSIYGYIESKTSTLTTLLGDLKSGRPVPVTIKIRYPEGSVADNQVRIEEYVQHGWARAPKDDDEPTSSNETSPKSDE